VVASRLNQVQLVGEPDVVLGRIVRTLAQSLRLRYAAVEVGDPPGGATVRAEYGVSDTEPQRVPLVWSGHRVGSLLVAVQAGRERFGRADRALLAEVARQVSAVGYALLLTSELQRSRQRLVLAREEERRRLRRDLHDGLGPTVAASAMNIEAVQWLVRSDPEAAEALLGRLLDEARHTIADVRRLVEGLRPLALDELGLVEAIQERVTSVTQPLSGSGARMSVVVRASGNFGSLPAAVEVAAFHITMEAVHNAARHSGAEVCEVRLDAGESLSIEVVDDGYGLEADAVEGVGLGSMRERAAEVGGALSIETPPHGGTVVRARLPLDAAPVLPPVLPDSAATGKDVP
jgi:two-component system NarL family sensor kinase